MADEMMGRDEYAGIHRACLKALGGDAAAIAWDGRRPSTLMKAVEVVLADQGWTASIRGFADREGITLTRVA